MKKIFGLAIVAALTAFNTSAQDWAKARLEKSPRHIEWVKVKNEKREVNCTVAYPEVKEKATAIIVIHEIFGLSDWARGVTDELAEAGYIAIAPDLLWGKAKDGGGTAELAKSGGDIREAIQSLPPDQITGDLNAVAAYVSKLPACNGKVVVCGFCWGGSQSFRFAANNKNLQAAFVFYGSGPEEEEDIARIRCPVYGFYAEKDARIGTTLGKTTELMRKAEKKFEPVTYGGAGHGFMRAGEAPDANDANRKARDDAWERWKKLLKKI